MAEALTAWVAQALADLGECELKETELRKEKGQLLLQISKGSERADDKDQIIKLQAELEKDSLARVHLQAETDEMSQQAAEAEARITVLLTALQGSKELQDTLVKQLHDQQDRFSSEQERNAQELTATRQRSTSHELDHRHSLAESMKESADLERQFQEQLVSCCLKFDSFTVDGLTCAVFATTACAHCCCWCFTVALLWKSQ